MGLKVSSGCSELSPFPSPPLSCCILLDRNSCLNGSYPIVQVYHYQQHTNIIDEYGPGNQQLWLHRNSANMQSWSVVPLPDSSQQTMFDVSSCTRPTPFSSPYYHSRWAAFQTDCWLSVIGALSWTVPPWLELIGEPLWVGGGLV
jgi:hypothetical protein